ncbi:hypothetical protein CTAYLR_002542 [Chrysophaeum taylorii]|uniref:tRNA/rRNA methyltransferase SpoU type domain-containing protein n=1 Tax=Chrysophaeum taylorii TaxID=2483200 RepID=A0AAD7UGJ5_9STRA|nr:hypothetical protein CTAYLR_002542 [Chrysophaeum taylorii]
MLAFVMVVALRGGVRRLSRSTATGEDAVFVEGSVERRARLDGALLDAGWDPARLEEDRRLEGSAALRMYRSFVLPKSEKALAIASQPQRARTVANQIAFLARETIAEQTAWLENRDREIAAGRPQHALDVILDGLRSGENVGNILRTFETAGARTAYACGTTPRPPNPAVLKAACRSAEYVDARHEPSALEVVRRLQRRNTTVLALETTPGRSVSLYDVRIPADAPVALVFGNELVGVAPEVLGAVDRIVHIPTFGTKNSLNVASAAAVAIFEVVRRQLRIDDDYGP